MTTDGGHDWSDVSPRLLRRPGWTLAGGLSGASFLSRSDFWIGVFNGAPDKVLPVEILHTTDGGRTWTHRGTLPGSYGGAWLYFVSRSRGWLMVDDGAAANQEPVTVYETTTAGRRWFQLSRGSSPTGPPGTSAGPSAGCDKTGISFSDRSSAWITGDCVGPLVLLHSRDGGRIWHDVALEPTHRISWGASSDPPIFFTPSDGVLEALLGTSRGGYDAIYTTHNGGRRWMVHRPPIASDGPMDVLSPTAWSVAHGHTLLTTTSGGTSWTSVRSSIALDGIGPDALDFVSATVGWTVSTNGALWHTTDRGRYWLLSHLQPVS